MDDLIVFGLLGVFPLFYLLVAFFGGRIANKRYSIGIRKFVCVLSLTYFALGWILSHAGLGIEVASRSNTLVTLSMLMSWSVMLSLGLAAVIGVVAAILWLAGVVTRGKE